MAEEKDQMARIRESEGNLSVSMPKKLWGFFLAFMVTGSIGIGVKNHLDTEELMTNPSARPGAFTQKDWEVGRAALEKIIDRAVSGNTQLILTTASSVEKRLDAVMQRYEGVIQDQQILHKTLVAQEGECQNTKRDNESLRSEINRIWWTLTQHTSNHPRATSGDPQFKSPPIYPFEHGGTPSPDFDSR